MWYSISVLICFLVQTQSTRLNNNGIYLDLTSADNSTQFSLLQNNITKLSGIIGNGKTFDIPETCDGLDTCEITTETFNLTIEAIDNGFKISWTSPATDIEFVDCLTLNAEETQWFGGPEKWTASWPVQNDVFVNRLYTTSKNDYAALTERYWLNSLGAYVFLQDHVPLYLDQNSVKKDALCFIAKLQGPYATRNIVQLEYHLVAFDNAKDAHLNAVNQFLGKPKSIPNEWIIRNPIWTTWAKYKAEINDEIVTKFVTDIYSRGFTGQIEIDDFWETCYGTLTFSEKNFGKINDTVSYIKSLNFTVTIWTHPFVNFECLETSKEGQDNSYFVKSINGSDLTYWWKGLYARHIDFTKEEAQNWYINRLKLLQDKHGIDSFKFDAGETDWAPPNPVLQGDLNLSPNSLTAGYARTCATFSNLLEIRTGFRTQDLGVLVRQIDKDSRWGLNNGLHAIITSMLTANIAGYVFVLPDMIGGNGNLERPTAELIARWTQANTFMPTMQFSFLPWEVTSDNFNNSAIIKKFVDLHFKYSDKIIEAMKNSTLSGTPVNPPIWWVDPTNPDALKCNDEYLLGSEILVAPVIKELATSRDVVLPAGSWKDGNNGTIYKGPTILENYPAPIDVLPYFILDKP